MVSPFRKSGAVDAVLTRRSSIFPTSRNSHSHGTDWNFQFLDSKVAGVVEPLLPMQDKGAGPTRLCRGSAEVRPPLPLADWVVAATFGQRRPATGQLACRLPCTVIGQPVAQAPPIRCFRVF
ncbi:hypothetical protein VTN96DRAFT_6182 [Rasamsonia emersonii]